MAASAYASLVSLTHVLDNVHYRAQHHRLCLDIVHIQTLQDRVHSLLDFVEAHSHQEGQKIRGLWRQISEVAFEAEQTFDSHVVNQLLCQSEGEISAFNEDVERLIQETDFIEKELSAVTMEGDDALVEQLPEPFVLSAGSQAAAWSEKDVLVGFDEHVVTIRDRLTSDERKLQIIPIIGMGGIGKTTLARNLYENSYIVDHFNLRFWLTISQDYSALQILNGLLDEDKESGGSLAELGVKLHKKLCGRRYLIVMDDVWTTQPCDDLMKYFPDNKNGSRIMMTTRLSEVATSLSCQNPYLMNFLKEDESWNLLCQKIFAQDGCPYPELESTGKDIAKSCRGLPLAIAVIGSQLAKSDMTQEYWKFVYGNMYSLGNLGDDDHCLKILSLSYNNLPVSLKPCFLYLRTFREDSEKDVLVGFDEHVVTIMDRLASDEPKLQIIPIIGMGGIGKTTLARNLYENSYIVDHFDLRFWLTISQDYNALQILNGLLDENKKSGGNLAESGGKLYRTLFGRRYLIVMDDVWTTQACDDLMKYFPDNENRSRIMMTTRLSEVATSLSCQNPYLMNFLNEDESWNLLCQKIFGQDDCPYPELEKTGKDIAKSCRGLPLAIAVIGSQLAKSNMMQEYWKFVYGNMYSLGNLGDDDHCLKILSLSYNNLPISLKPCFLYLRTFREDSEIEVSTLINLWVDEGFIKPKRDKSLEDIAEEYFKDLVGRNLLFIRKRAIGGEILSCGIHDLLRELCFQEYDNEHFLSTPRVQHVYHPRRNIFSVFCFFCSESIPKQKAMVMNVPEIVLIPSSASEVGPYVCDKCSTMYAHIRGLKLVRVMDKFGFGPNRGEIMHPTGLRHVSFDCNVSKLVYPSMLSVLWNLHTLIMVKAVDRRRLFALPPEIWDMPQLRRIDVRYIGLPHPIVDYVEENDAIMIMKNLQRLSAHIKSITEEILARIQNLKELTLNCPHNSYGCNCDNDCSLTNLAQLGKVEVLEVKRCRVENISFPNSLKKLELWNLRTPSQAITIIGSLPNLEELRLFYTGGWTEWMPVEGQFLRLKGLFMINCDLKCWEADQTHFPNLEWLKLRDCKHLLKIPLGIGNIATLRLIELKNCSESANDSTKQLREEQESYGNESLQLRVVHGGKERQSVHR